MSMPKDQERAVELIGQAMQHQMAQEFDRAIRLYKESIELYPTADAHTYLGWAYSFKGRLDDAIPWLERAKNAKRYEPRHFPYINLGRVYLTKGMLQKAIEEFNGSLKINPSDTELAELVEELLNKLH